jgi:hypothetical protein
MIIDKPQKSCNKITIAKTVISIGYTLNNNKLVHGSDGQSTFVFDKPLIKCDLIVELFLKITNVKP